MVIFSSGSQRFTWEGDWDAGAPSGRGELTADRLLTIVESAERAGSYRGEAVDGLPEGKTALIEYKALDENVFTETVPVSAGKYTIRATLTGDNSHETVTAVYNFSILPKEVSLKWENIAFTYDGAYHAPSAKLGDTIVGDHSFAEYIKNCYKK